MLRVLGFLCVLMMGAGPSIALQAPEGRIVLTVGGQIGTTNDQGEAAFDRAMLEALEWVEVETYTSFTEGPQRFAGPTLASVLAALDIEGTQLRATAINDYAILIPVAHAAAHNVILAMDHNGRPMRVRDKGPIWVVYPLSEQEAAAKPFDGEMIWQLVRLEVLP